MSPSEWARDFNALLDFTPHPHCRLTRYRDAVLLKWHAVLVERVPEWKTFGERTAEIFSYGMVCEEYYAADDLLAAITKVLSDRELISVEEGKAA